MQRFALLAILLICGCKKSKEAQCDELAKLGVAVADEVGKRLGGKDPELGKDPEIQAKLAELKAQCMAWPDEVFECLRADDDTSPKCRDAMSHVTGIIGTDLARVADGPKVIASAKLGDVDSDGLATSLSADGTLVAASKEWVAAYEASGVRRWRTDLRTAGWLVALGDGSLLVADREAGALVALDARTGRPRWTAAAPPPTDDASDGAVFEAAVRVGERAIVALSDGRFLRVDPGACAKQKQVGCVAVAFAIADERVFGPELLALGDTIVVGEHELIRQFTLDGTLRAQIAVRDTLGGVAGLAGTRIVATMDDEVVLWDLAKCPASPVILSRKRGRMYIKDDGDACEACRPPPAGCLVKRVELDDVESARPVVLRDGSIMVSNMDGPAQVAADGTRRWVSGVDAIGPMRELDGTIVFVSRADSETQPARLVAVDAATGKPKWKRALAGDSDLDFSTQAFVEKSGPWLVAGVKRDVFWLKP